MSTGSAGNRMGSPLVIPSESTQRLRIRATGGRSLTHQKVGEYLAHLIRRYHLVMTWVPEGDDWVITIQRVTALQMEYVRRYLTTTKRRREIALLHHAQITRLTLANPPAFTAATTFRTLDRHMRTVNGASALIADDQRVTVEVRGIPTSAAVRDATKIILGNGFGIVETAEETRPVVG